MGDRQTVAPPRARTVKDAQSLQVITIFDAIGAEFESARTRRDLAAQARELGRLGCTHAQGYLFSKPLTTRLVEDLLLRNQPLGPAAEPDEETSRWSVTFDWPVGTSG